MNAKPIITGMASVQLPIANNIDVDALEIGVVDLQSLGNAIQYLPEDHFVKRIGAAKDCARARAVSLQVLARL
jgi:hypothetical protein